MTTLKAVRGTRDLLPPETALWNRIETTARAVFARYNFGEIRTPIFEDTALFARSVGEETDIVSKEMYTWEDGERFNEPRMIVEWESRNRPDDPAHVQAGRARVERLSPLLTQLNAIGVQREVNWGVALPGTQLPGSAPEFVCFSPRISGEAISALLKAREIAKSDPASHLRQSHVRLRLVVPATAADNPWVERHGVTIEWFEGNFFDSTQSLTLRPENTAGVVRAYIEHQLGETGQLQKLYYIGPQFRRERPQKGRYRQFSQIGAEVIGPPSTGSESPLRDAEVLEMLATLLDELGITGWTLELNSVGSAADRARYNEALRAALVPVVSQMCVDCQRRAVTNPLRVLDCKVPADQPIIDTLPVIADSLDEASRAHFASVLAALDAADVPYTRNNRLVRGLDYYTRTTFEFTHGGLGAQNALLGGGRYDGLSEAIGGPRAPGIGFAMGEDRLVLTVQAQEHAKVIAEGNRVDANVLITGAGVKASAGVVTATTPQADAFIAPIGDALNAPALALAHELRSAGLVIELGDGSFRLKKSFEAADKTARRIVILGEDELQSGILTVKTFSTGMQSKVSRAELAAYLSTTASESKDPGSA